MRLKRWQCSAVSKETPAFPRKPIRNSMVGSCLILRCKLKSALLGATLMAVGTSGPAHAQPVKVGNPSFSDVYTDSAMAERVTLTSSTKSLRNPYYVGFWTQTTPAWDWWCGVSPDYRVYMNTWEGRSEIEQVLPEFLKPGTYAFAVKVYRTEGPFAVNVSADVVVGNTVLTPETSSSPEPELGTNTLWTRTYSITATNPLVGYPLKIRLGAGGPNVGSQRQVAFDDVSLELNPGTQGKPAPVTVANPSFNDIYDSYMAERMTLTSPTRSLRDHPYYLGFWTQLTFPWDWWCGVGPDYRVYMNTWGGRSEIEQVLPDFLQPGSYTFSVKVYRNEGPFAVNVSADLVVGYTVLTPETSSSPEPDLGTNTLWTRTYSIAATNPLVGYPLKIRLGAGGPNVGEQRQVAFDDVSLAWLAPKIVAVALTNHAITLDLNYLIPAATTVVQRTCSLTSADWSNVHSHVANQAATNWTEQLDGGRERAFYRVVSQY